MLYQVFDCGRPADCFHTKVHESWNKSIFETEQQAQEYAARWLGQFSNVCPLPINTPVDYDGMGDMIEIKAL